MVAEQAATRAGAGIDLTAQLQGFRETHPVQRLAVGGLEWEYVAGGRAGEWLVLLSGGGGVAESGFRRIRRFEDKYRVIAPSYPAEARTIAALADGVFAILDQEGAATVHLHGHSLGGALAQCCVRRHPERVRSMVLANIGVASAGRMRATRLLASALKLMPGGMVRRLFEARVRRNIRGLDAEERAFYEGYLEELSARYLSKDFLLNQLQILMDFAMAYRFGPADLADWAGRVLILESDDDSGFDAAERQALRALYPGAQVHTFPQGGHLAGALQRDAYDAVVETFLRSV